MSPIGPCNLLIYNQYLYVVYSEFFTGLAVHLQVVGKVMLLPAIFVLYHVVKMSFVC